MATYQVIVQSGNQLDEANPTLALEETDQSYLTTFRIDGDLANDCSRLTMFWFLTFQRSWLFDNVARYRFNGDLPSDRLGGNSRMLDFMAANTSIRHGSP